MRRFTFTILLLAAFGVHVAPAIAQSIELEPPRIYEGDVTRLNIEYESKIPSLYALDTRQFEQDFELLRLDSRVSRITDRQTAGSRMEWTLELAPKRAGTLAIPPIRLGENLTPTATLQVEAGSHETGTPADVFVRLRADPPQPYRGQQTRISMMLYQAARLSGGRWREPETDAGRIFHSGHETVDRVTLDDVTYRRTTRSLVLFPAAEGLLFMSPAAVVGDLEVTSASDPDNLYPPGLKRTLYRRSEPLRIEVQSLPADHREPYWLPAFALQLSQQWDDDVAAPAVGDTLQRTITIEARGLPADVLPTDLLAETSPEIRIFPDQPVLGNRFDADMLVGRLRQSFAVLLTRAGEIRLPPVELAWWDLQADRARTARLPGRTIRVAASGDPALDGTAYTGLAFTGRAAGTVPGKLQKAILIACVIALYLAWIALGERLTARLRGTRLRLRALRQLRRACDAGDARAARAALLSWARQRWPGQTTYGLAQISARLPSASLRSALNELDAAIYRPGGSKWQGRALWRVLRTTGNSSRGGERDGASQLPRLYPGLPGLPD
ncbi:MAG: BatD family protein [Gammaproteobacteria bacterium]|nr:BatD family protein [Gammaproteobacteria bacterium]